MKRYSDNHTSTSGPMNSIWAKCPTLPLCMKSLLTWRGLMAPTTFNNGAAVDTVSPPSVLATHWSARTEKSRAVQPLTACCLRLAKTLGMGRLRPLLNDNHHAGIATAYSPAAAARLAKLTIEDGHRSRFSMVTVSETRQCLRLIVCNLRSPFHLHVRPCKLYQSL